MVPTKPKFLESIFWLTLISSSSSSFGSEDTNRSFSEFLRIRINSLLFSFSSFSSSGESNRCFSWSGGDSRRRRLVLRQRSIRREVFRRGSWTSGLVLGLRVGLWATPHCIASSLNLCSVAIFVSLLSFTLSRYIDLWICLFVCEWLWMWLFLNLCELLMWLWIWMLGDDCKGTEGNHYFLEGKWDLFWEWLHIFFQHIYHWLVCLSPFVSFFVWDFKGSKEVQKLEWPNWIKGKAQGM